MSSGDLRTSLLDSDHTINVQPTQRNGSRRSSFLTLSNSSPRHHSPSSSSSSVINSRTNQAALLQQSYDEEDRKERDESRYVGISPQQHHLLPSLSRKSSVFAAAAVPLPPPVLGDIDDEEDEAEKEDIRPFVRSGSIVISPAAANALRRSLPSIAASDDEDEDDDDLDLDTTTAADIDMLPPIDQFHQWRHSWWRTWHCDRACVQQRCFRLMPALTWLPQYKVRTSLLPDLLAGVMLAVVAIPQGMAYATLAGLPPIVGLYSCLIPPITYAFFGCSPSMHIGPFSLVSLLVLTSVQAVVPAGAPDEYAHDVVFLFSILVGCVLLLMSLLRLGFAVSFLADCVLSAYTCAAACLTMASQLKSLFGLHDMPSGLTFIQTWIWVFKHVKAINPTTLGLGIFSMIVLLVVDKLNLRFKLRVPIPSQLVVVIFGILIAGLGKLDDRTGLKVIGHIPSGLPPVGIPGLNKVYVYTDEATGQQTTIELLSMSNVKLFIQPACMLALLVYLISISIAKNFATKTNEKNAKERAKAVRLGMPLTGLTTKTIEIDANQELFALGLANLFGGFFSAYPSSGSLSRSALVYNAGIKSSLHNVFSATLLVVVLLLLTPMLYYLPMTCLAGIIFVALKSLLIQYKECIRLYRTNNIKDFIMWLTTFIATILFDTQIGIGVGVGVSVIMLIFQSSRPAVATLGKVIGTGSGDELELMSLNGMSGGRSSPMLSADTINTSREAFYKDIKYNKYQVTTYRGILIFQFNSPMHFANKDYFLDKLALHVKRAEKEEWARVEKAQVKEEMRRLRIEQQEQQAEADEKEHEEDEDYLPEFLPSDSILNASHSFASTPRVHTEMTAIPISSLTTGIVDETPADWENHSTTIDMTNAQQNGTPNTNGMNAPLIADATSDSDAFATTRASSSSTSSSSSNAADDAVSPPPVCAPSVGTPTNGISASLNAAINASSSDRPASPSILAPTPYNARGSISYPARGSISLPIQTPSAVFEAASSAAGGLVSFRSLLSQHPHQQPQQILTEESCRITSIILDCRSLTEIDDASIQMLKALPQQLSKRVYYVDLNRRVLRRFIKMSFFEYLPPSMNAVNGNPIVSPPSRAVVAAVNEPKLPGPLTCQSPPPSSPLEQALAAQAAAQAASASSASSVRPFDTIHEAVLYVLQLQRDNPIRG